MVMRTKQRRKSNRGRWIVPCFAIAFLAYFGFHAVNGDLGLNAKVQIEARRDRLQKELDALVAERTELEHRSALLQDGTMDADMVDQQARAMLEFARPDDLVIYR